MCVRISGCAFSRIMDVISWNRILALAICYTIVISLCDGRLVRTVDIPADVPVGYEVTKISNVKGSYTFESDYHSLFSVQDNGAVVTKDKLTHLVGSSLSLVVKDRTNSEIIGSLHISILEPSSSSLSSSKHLVFQQSKYIGLIDENQPSGSKVNIIGHLNAECCDNHVTYSLFNGSDVFSVKTVYFGSTHDNVLTSLKSLNRELQDLYTLVLEAKCLTDGLSASTIIEIHVIDRNDIIPKFKSTDLYIQTTTDQSLHEIVTVQAYDGDQNERLLYSLNENSHFYIGPESGKLYSEEDYLPPGSYGVIVVARDAVGHTSEPLNVHIEVISDVLKFEPQRGTSVTSHSRAKRATIQLNKTHYIIENSTSRYLFSVASVNTPPSGERYSVLSESVLDLILPPNGIGEVYLIPGQILDYENLEHRRINLVYNRTNIDNPGEETILDIVLEVQDRNDEKPVFKNRPYPYLATVSTNPSLEENVYTLYAEDLDQNSRLQYRLESGGEGKFKIVTEEDPATGDLVGKIVTTVSGPGQFLDGREYTLVVSAQDVAAGVVNPQKSDFAIVKVKVGQRPPQLFENPFRAKVFENSGTGYRIMDHNNNILRILVKLFRDTAQNQTSFNLTEPSGKLSGLFSISSKGFVTTLQNLDYEEPPNQYILNVTATEVATGLSSTSQLIIDVEDVNDNSPKFQLSTYTFRLSEDTPIGGPALALQVVATDRDSGYNGQLEYFVSDDHFSIQTSVVNNQYVGMIKVNKKLDYDFRPDHQYRFNVTARDNGEIPRSGMASVIVYVKNVNDEAPVFGSSMEHLYASISEDSTIDSVVTIIQATDPDGDNVKYYFTRRIMLNSKKPLHDTGQTTGTSLQLNMKIS